MKTTKENRASLRADVRRVESSHNQFVLALLDDLEAAEAERAEAQAESRRQAGYAKENQEYGEKQWARATRLEAELNQRALRATEDMSASVEIQRELSKRMEAAEARADKAEDDLDCERGKVDMFQGQAVENAKRAEQAEARVSLAEDLLSRVVIHGGSGSWSWREMYDWCCDYKDWKNRHETFTPGHGKCGHRERPGTDCGAIGSGSSDEPVHHIFGPGGLFRRVEKAEARIAELEAERDRLAEELRAVTGSRDSLYESLDIEQGLTSHHTAANRRLATENARLREKLFGNASAARPKEEDSDEPDGIPGEEGRGAPGTW